jgi:GNAT superfamily N-acetyltransferase
VNPVIQRCRSRGDLDGLAALCSAHADYEDLAFDPAGFEDRLSRWIEARELSVAIWMARDGAVPCGYAAASVEFSTLAAARYLHLDCLFVSDGMRSRGIGERLMGEVAGFARAEGLGHVEWQTPSWNARAVRFYERLGAKALTKLRFSVSSRHLCS